MTETPPPEAIDDLDCLLEVMPRAVQHALQDQNDLDDLVEVVLDLGREPEARFPDHTVILSETLIRREDLKFIVDRLGDFGTDNRAGIERTLHRISALRNRTGDIVGLTCRVGRSVVGTVDILRDVIEDGQSVLLLGRPGVGKTTLLRESARVLADDLDKRVVVVDTSNEIAGDGDVPHSGIGRARRMQVPSPDRQHAVMIEAVENHMPQVIVIDEIGTQAEALAARTIAERGVMLIATAHGNTLDNLLQNPTLSDLLGGIQAVTLSDEEARRRNTQKTVLERKAPATFDVVVEIQTQDRLAVHRPLQEVVDQMLRGVALRPELRTRTEDGEVEIQEARVEAQLSMPHMGGLRESLREGPGEDLHTPFGRRRRKRLKLFPYAVSRGKLQRAVREMGLPVILVDQLRDAEMILTVKGHERRQPHRLRQARARGVRLEVLRSNTPFQIERFLREEFKLDAQDRRTQEALDQAQQAAHEALESGQPVELSPQDSQLRRLQHEAVEEAGLTSSSKGKGPYRRLVVYPN